MKVNYHYIDNSVAPLSDTYTQHAFYSSHSLCSHSGIQYRKYKIQFVLIFLPFGQFILCTVHNWTAIQLIVTKLDHIIMLCAQ